MIKSLYISSFVIIDEVKIDFFDGLSVLTGETGAGKSIVIDALSQLCGARSSGSIVRNGDDKAIIEGVFEVNDSTHLRKIFNELDIDYDNEIIIRKEIFANGKSQVKINYRNATNAALKSLSPYLIHIHSQFESQLLFQTKNHLNLLDRYIGKQINHEKDIYVTLYDEYKNLLNEKKRIIEEDFSDEQIEYYQTQLLEFEDFDYSDDNIEEFEHELEILKNYEKMNEHIQNFDQLLGHDSALSMINTAIKELQILQDQPDFEEAYNNLYNHFYAISDDYESIIDTFNNYHFDEYRFNELQEILFKAQRLKRKYGYNMSDVYKAKKELIQKIETSNHRDQLLKEIEKKIKIVLDQLASSAEKLTHLRKEGAKCFEKEILTQLIDLYLPKAQLKVEIQHCDYNKNGFDTIQFMVAMNEGQSFSPLNESASGGEISRLILAMKTILLKDDFVETIVFDEVDTGVSGKVATSIGEKIKQLAKFKQVICITHLPQVAVYAQYHYSILKENNDHQTYTSVKLLNKQQRVEEIANMLSGEKISDEAIANAKKLMNV